MSPRSLPQMIRQLENELDKMRAKVRAAEKVGAVYERVHDALQKVSSSSAGHRPTRSPCKGSEVPLGALVLVGHPPGSARSFCSPP